MADAQRLFIGITVGPSWTAALAALADDLREELGRAVRWVRPELYHVTVVFLGNQAPESLPAIEEALVVAAAGGEPFALSLSELRRLGGHERGALVAGVRDDTGALQRFRARLDAELQHRDVLFDSKRLVPHVTLGRPRGKGGIPPLPQLDFRVVPPLTVTAIDLVHSDLQPTGPVYRIVAQAALQRQS